MKKIIAAFDVLKYSESTKNYVLYIAKHGFSYIKDGVGVVIEKALESGGDVEFVNKDVVKDYGHIEMVQYY